MYPEKQRHIGIVIVPLKSLISELVKRCKSRHVRAVALVATEEMLSSEIKGNYLYLNVVD